MKKIAILFFFLLFSYWMQAQCVTCGNGVADAGETNLNCPQDVPHSATCTSPCGQPSPFETATGLRDAYDFVGATTYGTASLPVGWSFAGAPTATTAGALPAADAYGAKAGLVQPNCSGSCTGTNGFCIGNLANLITVGSGGTGGKLGANFDGRSNISQNLSYAVLRGQNNPTLVSPTYNVSGVEGFKIQIWLNASETSCGQTNGWGSCTGNNVFLDFSANGGTSWTQIMTLNTSSTNSDMCTSNSTNTFWIQEGTWSRLCLTVFKTSTATGNFYPAASGTTAASGMMVDASYFTANFKYRIRYSQSASCTGTVTTTNPGRYLAIDYPVFTSGNQMIPCGISFANMCGYGADNNDDGVGSAATTTTTVFGTTRRSVNQAERGVEIFTSQSATFGGQNLSGSNFVTDFDLCNAEGGDKQCINWQISNVIYNVAYEAIMDFEISNINLQYYKGTTPSSTTLSKVTTAGKTAAVGWRYSGSRTVGCGANFSDLNPGCNGYYFTTGSLPNQFIRAFYQLAINSSGQAWSFYGPTSCSHYFGAPSVAPIILADTVSNAGNYITCTAGGTAVFTGITKLCFGSVGIFSGTPTLAISGPNGFAETITSGGTGSQAVVDAGTYTIVPQTPNNPVQCINCARPVCISLTTSDLTACPQSLALAFVDIKTQVHRNNEILVQWDVERGEDVTEFILERSIDGVLFEEIARQTAQTEVRKYEWIDRFPNAGNNYYRLKMSYRTGERNVSRIAVQYVEKPLWIQVFPNPTSDVFTFHAPEILEDLSIEIFNTSGQLVQKQFWTSQQATISVQDLPKGVYFVQFSNKRILYTTKLIKL